MFLSKNNPKVHAYFLVTLLLFSGAISAQVLPPGVQNVLSPFTTDGCSKAGDTGLRIIDGNEFEINWRHCCVAHDIWYWKGGTEKQRSKADSNFYQCLRGAGMGKTKAQAFYVAVRLGQNFLDKSIFRWGNGWKYLRAYAPFTKSDLKQIKKLEPTLNEALAMEHDPGLRPPVELPRLTDNLCADQVLYKIQQRAQSHSVKKITVTDIIQKTKLKGEWSFAIRIADCETAIEVPMKTSIKQCESYKYRLPKLKRAFSMSQLNRAVDHCFEN